MWQNFYVFVEVRFLMTKQTISVFLILLGVIIFPVVGSTESKRLKLPNPLADTKTHQDSRREGSTDQQLQEIKGMLNEISRQLNELQDKQAQLNHQFKSLRGQADSASETEAELAKPGSLRWKQRVYPPGDRHGAISVSPAIHPRGPIIVGGQKNGERLLIGIDTGGAIQWRKRGVRGEVAVGPNGTIYGKGTEKGRIVALDPETRAIVWRSTSTDGGSRVSVGPDGYLYTQNSNGELFKFSPDDGTLRWRFKSEIDGERFGDGISIDGDGVSYFTGHSLRGQGDRQMYALRSDGRVKWTYQYDGESRSMPAIGADGSVYVLINFGGGLSNDNGTLVAFTPEGDVKWKYKTGDLVTHMNDATFRSHSHPVIGPEDHIYVGSSNGYLYKLTPEGELAWKFKADGPVKSTPAVAGDRTVFAGDEKGNVYAIGPDGTEHWRFNTDGRIHGSVNMDRKGNIYFTSWDGFLYSLATSADGLAGSSWPRYRHDPQQSGSR